VLVIKTKKALVCAIPHGAVPMARVIVDAIGGELDIVLVRKIGHPSQPELAIGAIDERGTVFLSGYALGIEAEYLEAGKERQLAILRRERALYTSRRAPIDVHDRIVIVVDDGMATGSTMMAALRAIRTRKPKKLLAAVAVTSAPVARSLSREADYMVCLKVASEFYAVGQFFKDFTQVSDQLVIKTLRNHGSKFSIADHMAL
jgi:putative phosphoribosyl transferase